jgi:hypothetical protein
MEVVHVIHKGRANVTWTVSGLSRLFGVDVFMSRFAVSVVSVIRAGSYMV